MAVRTRRRSTRSSTACGNYARKTTACGSAWTGKKNRARGPGAPSLRVLGAQQNQAGEGTAVVRVEVEARAVRFRRRSRLPAQPPCFTQVERGLRELGVVLDGCGE